MNDGVKIIIQHNINIASFQNYAHCVSMDSVLVPTVVRVILAGLEITVTKVTIIINLLVYYYKFICISAVCLNGCAYGVCDFPDVCKCDSGYTGDIRDTCM